MPLKKKVSIGRSSTAAKTVEQIETSTLVHVEENVIFSKCFNVVFIKYLHPIE